MDIMNMTVAQIAGYLVCIVGVMSVFIEITPIKITPVTNMLAWLGKKINADVLEKVKDLDGRIDSLSKELADMKACEEEQEAINCRIRILAFADELRFNRQRSKDSFEQTLLDIDTYENYCAAHKGFKNSLTSAADKFIKEVYFEAYGKNDFL